MIWILLLSAIPKLATPKIFNNINARFGISLRAVNSVCKDNLGFIWASSKTGILRLTQDNFRLYQLPYETAGAIIVKLTFENHKLMAYSDNGQIFYYNAVNDRFELIINLRRDLGLQQIELYDILVDKSGILWLALSSGLFSYQSGNLAMVEPVSGRYAVAWYDPGQIIITDGNGIRLFDVDKHSMKTVYTSASSAPLAVSSLFLEAHGKVLWIGTMASGLFRYDFTSDAYTAVLETEIPLQPILALSKSSDSTILAGIDGQGLWELNLKGDRILQVYKENADDPSSIRGNGVYDIFHDPGKRIWVCTISGGVSYFDLSTPLVTHLVHQPNNPNSLVNNEVNGILEDRQGKIWVATNNGIGTWNPKTGEWKSYYGNKLEQAQVFLTLCEDEDGRIWAGSYSSGFYVLDQYSGKEIAWYSNQDERLKTVSNFIFSILKDSEGDLWIGGVNGAFTCYRRNGGIFQIYFPEPVSSFKEIKPGQILVGLSYGLSLLDKHSGNYQILIPGIPVQDMHIMKDKVWIGTSGEGLIGFDTATGEMEKYDILSGLSSNFVNSIAYADGFLWLGTENGLCRFDPESKTVHSYHTVTPLSGISFNKSSVTLLRNGQLALGSSNGVVIFHPRVIGDVSPQGRIFIQDMMISGRSVRDITSIGLAMPVDSLDLIRLKYFQNTVNLELVPVGEAKGTKFSWMLEGFDDEWQPPTDNRTITYTNLPHGRFVLKIRLLDNSSTNILQERSLQIHIRPPYWRKAWFLVLGVVVVLGLVFLYFLYYINRLKQKHTEEKVRFFTFSTHDMRTSLTLIKAPVEELVHEQNISESGKYYLSLALGQIQHLLSVVTQLMDFQKADTGREQLVYAAVDLVSLVRNRIFMFSSLAESYNIPLVFQADCDHFPTAIDGSKIEKVLDNLISNAIKYSKPSSAVEILLKCGKTHWQLQVIDKGIGIGEKEQKYLFREFFRGENAVGLNITGTGIGLLLVKKYVTLHGGKVNFESRENEGTTFIIQIPCRDIKDAGSVYDPSSTISGLPSGIYSPYGNHQEVVTRGRELHVLIAEDNGDLLHFMHHALKPDFVVSTAGNGTEAWHIIKNKLPDLVISDVMMPEMDGFELCHKVKSTFETAHIPVILLTALSDTGNELHGLGMGADDYITKPFDMMILKQKMVTIVSNRAAVREKAIKMIHSGSEDKDPLLENDLNDQFVRKMYKVVMDNLANPDFGKEDFASAMHVSTSLLYKKIKALTDLSPTDYVKTIRLSHAYDLLKSGKYSVTEVSELCGFASVGYFSTVFKKHFRELPSEL